MSDLAYLLDLDHNDPADPSDVDTLYICDASRTEGFGTVKGETPDAQQFLTLLKNRPSRIVETASGGLSSGPTSARTITARLARYVSGGPDRLAALEGRNIFGQRAFLRAVGTGGDGTAYPLTSPAVIADGTVVGSQKSSRYWDVTIQPNRRIHQSFLPSRRLLGYPHGLRFNGNTAEADVPYSTVPAAFTLVALLLTPMDWTVGATDHQTIFGQDSINAYYEASSTYKRRVMLNVRNAADTGWHTLQGSEWEPDDEAHFMSWRFNTTTRAARVSLDTAFEDLTAPADFGALTANWKLGRLKNSMINAADTIIAGWAMFSEWLTDAQLINIMSGRMTGSEDDLVFWFPGESLAGTLFDYAEVNAASPLDATITDAVAAPMMTGTAELAGSLPPQPVGLVRNVPATPIDPSRKISSAGGNVGSIFSVYDRAVPYNIEATYSSPLDFADNPPTADGNVTACPRMGGLVRIHTERDGVENTIDCGGLGLYDFSLNLGTDFGNSKVDFGTQLDSVYNSGAWGQEIFFYVGNDGPDAGVVWFSEQWRLTATFDSNDDSVSILKVLINLDGGGDLQMQVPVGVRRRVAVKVQAWNDGSGGSASRMLVDGNVVATDSDNSNELDSITSSLAHQLMWSFEQMAHIGVLPMRLFSAVEATDALAEAEQRKYLFNNPPPTASDLEGLWVRSKGDPLVLVDETANGYDGTVDAGAVWGPRPGCVGPFGSAMSVLDGVPVTVRDAAYVQVPLFSFGEHVSGERTLADIAASLLDGAGLFLVQFPDGSVEIGRQPDPSSDDPIGVLLVADADPAAVTNLPPSAVRVRWGFNPAIQSSILAGADDDRRSFASKAWRSDDFEVEASAGILNRDLYSDDPLPDGRRLEFESGYYAKSAASVLAARRGEIWKGPRPVRKVRLLRRLAADGSGLGTNGAFCSVEVGGLYTIRWDEAQPVHSEPVSREEVVAVLSIEQSLDGDVLTVR